MFCFLTLSNIESPFKNTGIHNNSRTGCLTTTEFISYLAQTFFCFVTNPNSIISVLHVSYAIKLLLLFYLSIYSIYNNLLIHSVIIILCSFFFSSRVNNLSFHEDDGKVIVSEYGFQRIRESAPTDIKTPRG